MKKLGTYLLKLSMLFSTIWLGVWYDIGLMAGFSLCLGGISLSLIIYAFTEYFIDEFFGAEEYDYE